jgi:hypothetical protein
MGGLHREDLVQRSHPLELGSLAGAVGRLGSPVSAIDLVRLLHLYRLLRVHEQWLAVVAPLSSPCFPTACLPSCLPLRALFWES